MEPLAIVLLLAKMCVAEIGFREDVSECQLMWQVNQTNADRHGRNTRRTNEAVQRVLEKRTTARTTPLDSQT